MYSTGQACAILMKFELLPKNTQISNFIKLRPVGAELFPADRHTDGHDEANSRFSQFYERGNNETVAGLSLLSPSSLPTSSKIGGDAPVIQ
jgi:hypothetical protein